MQDLFSPLVAIIDPPDIQSGMPGDLLKLSVVIQNQGNQGAVIDVFLDDADQILSQWCRSVRQRLALDPQQSSEVVFEFALPVSALAGTYDYTIVVDAPEHYPEDTPLQYPQQMRVLLREQTVVRNNDPSFFLSPATHPKKPARLNPGETLSVQVRVENRSTLVDKFRLTCPDLEEEWFIIRYPSNSLAAPGLVAEVNSLELNPNTQGFLQLELHPPIDTLAGVYSPTFRLYSDNQPDLVLLDLVYLEIRPIEQMIVELEAIVDRVSHNSGQYKLRLNNQGNLIRQLSFTATGRDEEELCSYTYDPPQVRLSPNREAQTLLLVTPLKKWRRPFLGMGQAILFQVEMQDVQGYKLPERLPQGTLIWKARPWWQFVLLVLTILGLLGGLGFLIWLLFFKPPAPPEIVEFKPDSPKYTEGSDKVRLTWKITHPDRIDHLELTTAKDATSLPPILFKPADLQAKNTCPGNPEQLCTLYLTDAAAAGKYVFHLKVVPRSGNPPQSPPDVPVTIVPKPDPSVVQFAPMGSEYDSDKPVELGWDIANIGQLASLTVIARDDGNTDTPKALYSGTTGLQAAPDLPAELRSVCQVAGNDFTCKRFPFAGLRSGSYRFLLQGKTTKGKPFESQPSTPVKIKAPKMHLNAKLNTETSGIVNVKPNEPLAIYWDVTGGEGTLKIQVEPGCSTSTERSGECNLGKAPENGFSVKISVIDETRPAPQTDSMTFSVNVLKPSPPPSPVPPLRSSPPQQTQPSNRSPIQIPGGL